MAYARVKTWAAGEKLTAADLNAEFDAVQADVNTKDGGDLADATVTTAKLASPNAAFSVLVRPCSSADALASGTIGGAVPGVDNDRNTLDTHFQTPSDCTITGISTFCRASSAAGGARSNDAQLFVNGTAIGSAVGFTSGDVVDGASLSQSVQTTDTLEIRVNTDSASTDGVTDPHVWVHCVAVHQA